MATLTAGSYLKLMSNPEMDLMDVVNEEAPVLKRKEDSDERHVTYVFRKLNHVGQLLETSERTVPTRLDHRSIAYENTHGERFGHCHQEDSWFTMWPADPHYLTGRTAHSTKPGVYTFNQSAFPQDWHWWYVENVHRDGKPTFDKTGEFGLVFMDHGDAISNALYPEKDFDPWKPVHLPLDEEDALDVDAELVRAFDVIRPAVSSDTSLLVTLAELKDVKSLFSEPLAFANRFIQTVGRKKAKNLTFSKILTDPELIGFFAKSLAKGKLYKEFGLKQTMRDITSLYSTFYSLDRVVRDILGQLGDNTRHYSPPDFLKEVEYNDVSWAGPNWLIVRNWKTTLYRKFVCTVKYHTELVDAFGKPISPEDRALVRLGAAMDTLGVNMNPAILWDLVPFSFVVDYFVGIGNWLERYKRSNLNFTFSVRDACWSTKILGVTDSVTRLYRAGYDQYERHPDDPEHAFTGSRYVGGAHARLFTSKYDRTRFFPTLRMLSGETLPDLRVPCRDQWKIMASLLTQNLPIGRKR